VGKKHGGGGAVRFGEDVKLGLVSVVVDREESSSALQGGIVCAGILFAAEWATRCKLWLRSILTPLNDRGAIPSFERQTLESSRKTRVEGRNQEPMS
jgi:hypothetical protein